LWFSSAVQHVLTMCKSLGSIPSHSSFTPPFPACFLCISGLPGMERQSPGLPCCPAVPVGTWPSISATPCAHWLSLATWQIPKAAASWQPVLRASPEKVPPVIGRAPGTTGKLSVFGGLPSCSHSFQQCVEKSGLYAMTACMYVCCTCLPPVLWPRGGLRCLCLGPPLFFRNSLKRVALCTQGNSVLCSFPAVPCIDPFLLPSNKYS
jgi:hypothetical protein